MAVYQLKNDPVPAGKHKIGLSAIKAVETEQWGVKHVFEFTCIEGEYEGQPAGSIWVNPNAMGPKSGLYKAVKLLLGEVPKTIDTDDLIGTAGIAHIDRNEQDKNQILFFERDPDLTKAYRQQLREEAAQEAAAEKVQAEQEAEVPF